MVITLPHSHITTIGAVVGLYGCFAEGWHERLYIHVIIGVTGNVLSICILLDVFLEAATLQIWQPVKMI